MIYLFSREKLDPVLNKDTVETNNEHHFGLSEQGGVVGALTDRVTSKTGFVYPYSVRGQFVERLGTNGFIFGMVEKVG